MIPIHKHICGTHVLERQVLCSSRYLLATRIINFPVKHATMSTDVAFNTSVLLPFINARASIWYTNSFQNPTQRSQQYFQKDAWIIFWWWTDSRRVWLALRNHPRGLEPVLKLLFFFLKNGEQIRWQLYLTRSDRELHIKIFDKCLGSNLRLYFQDICKLTNCWGAGKNASLDWALTHFILTLMEVSEIKRIHKLWRWKGFINRLKDIWRGTSPGSFIHRIIQS